MRVFRSMLSFGLSYVAAPLVVCALAGCERKEKVLDVETPGTNVEVERNLDTGEVEVDVERSRRP